MRVGNYKYILTGIIFLMTFSILAQRPHLEVGGVIGFKDEFHFRPNFDNNSKYTEFHTWEAEAFLRISKLRFGGEIGAGFEKPSHYFIRQFDNSTNTKYFNLNRVSLNASAFFYFIKKKKFKWDLQIGARNYFNLTSRIFIPHEQQLKTWKLASRFSTNFTYKYFHFGIYYEKDIRTDYPFHLNGAVFGFRAGVII